MGDADIVSDCDFLIPVNCPIQRGRRYAPESCTVTRPETGCTSTAGGAIPPDIRPSLVQNGLMASYSVNPAAVEHARTLIRARQYVRDSDWGESQHKAADENAFLESHSWDAYAEWHLGLAEGASDETKARYAFGYGDFRRVHRTGLIACVYRAAEWRHKDIELAAHDLLQYFDQTTA